MTSKIQLLVPRPRQAHRTAETLDLSAPIPLRSERSEDLTEAARRRLRTVLETSDLAPQLAPSEPTAAEIAFRPGDAETLGPDAYDLDISSAGIEITATTSSGYSYGVETLAQWIRLHSSGIRSGRFELPGLVVRDWPAFRRRGVMLDVSRNKVPTNATLFDLVDKLASWKINELQLYTEHTFAYEGHEAVWSDWSPITAEDIRSLDAYCTERHIELVPNQQSFGHFHRWLIHERYRHLAECPSGIDHPFSGEREPFSLCPTDPAVVDLLDDLYGQLLPNFSSQILNAGLDETFDLGLGRSAEVCAEEGKHKVYLRFLQTVHGLARKHGRRLQFWSDIILDSPASIDRIPGDAIALDWGYEADHPFAEETAALAAAGLDFYVCPGTSSWNSFAGRAHNALENLASAARFGELRRAAGYLVTDWGDNGHLQPLVASYLGLLAGAAFAWNPPTEDETPGGWHRLLDLHVFGNENPGLGRAALALGNAYLATDTPSRNGSALFHLVMSPNDSLEHSRYSGLTERGLERVRAAVSNSRDFLHTLQPTDGNALAREELLWTAEAIDLGARVGQARLASAPAAPLAALSPALRDELSAAATALGQRLRPVWLARNREGGFAASLARLNELAALLHSA